MSALANKKNEFITDIVSVETEPQNIPRQHTVQTASTCSLTNQQNILRTNQVHTTSNQPQTVTVTKNSSQRKKKCKKTKKKKTPKRAQSANKKVAIKASLMPKTQDTANFLTSGKAVKSVLLRSGDKSAVAAAQGMEDKDIYNFKDDGIAEAFSRPTVRPGMSSTDPATR